MDYREFAWFRIEGKCTADPTGCLIWNGARRGSYGVVRIKENGKHRTRNVHRAAYAVKVGDVPDGHSVMHHSGNKLCCNPDHLFLKVQPLDLSSALEAA